jgi:hypothetical protein
LPDVIHRKNGIKHTPKFYDTVYPFPDLDNGNQAMIRSNNGDEITKKKLEANYSSSYPEEKSTPSRGSLEYSNGTTQNEFLT